MMTEVAIVGDVHLNFSHEDVTYFNQSNYDLVLFVGDLSNWSPRRGVRLASTLRELELPALFVPGNHDTVILPQLLAEIRGYPMLSKLFGIGQGRRDLALQKALGKIEYGGYSIHRYDGGESSFEVIAGRPYSMGGPHLSCKPMLRARYGVSSVMESAELIRKQIDLSVTDSLIFLAHNGPVGLGGARSDIWGNDFSAEPGDYGDLDLKLAVDYAISVGKRILAVIGGHMHHHLRGGGRRTWLFERDSIHYVNAARVPRIFPRSGRMVRHHVKMSFDAHRVEIQEMLVH